jgi:hypothetical protein
VRARRPARAYERGQARAGVRSQRGQPGAEASARARDGAGAQGGRVARAEQPCLEPDLGAPVCARRVCPPAPAACAHQPVLRAQAGRGGSARRDAMDAECGASGGQAAGGHSGWRAQRAVGAEGGGGQRAAGSGQQRRRGCRQQIRTQGRAVELRLPVWLANPHSGALMSWAVMGVRVSCGVNTTGVSIKSALRFWVRTVISQHEAGCSLRAADMMSPFPSRFSKRSVSYGSACDARAHKVETARRLWVGAHPLGQYS